MLSYALTNQSRISSLPIPSSWLESYATRCAREETSSTWRQWTPESTNTHANQRTNLCCTLDLIGGIRDNVCSLSNQLYAAQIIIFSCRTEMKGADFKSRKKEERQKEGEGSNLVCVFLPWSWRRAMEAGRGYKKKKKSILVCVCAEFQRWLDFPLWSWFKLLTSGRRRPRGWAISGKDWRWRDKKKKEEEEWDERRCHGELGESYFLWVFGRGRRARSVRSLVQLINLWQEGFLCAVPRIAALIYMVIFFKTLAACRKPFILSPLSLNPFYTRWEKKNRNNNI